MKLIIITLMFLLLSCEKNVTHKDEIKLDKDQTISIVFSHNINGETVSCGCSNFPLGGFSQIYGMFKKIEAMNPILYLETGDSLFSSSNLPKSVMDIQLAQADTILKAYDILNLKYFLPGDQDFAAGTKYLETISKNSKFDLLISNFSSKSIKHTKWTSIKAGKATLFLISIADPSIFPIQYQGFFTPPFDAIKKSLENLNEAGYNPANKDHRLILLSHSGSDSDKVYAQKFPMIDWIIGAHDQKFTQIPIDVGNTKLVQVLSRNHYLGEIKINIAKGKTEDSFVSHQITDDLKGKSDPMIKLMDEHKLTIKELKDKKYGNL